LVDCYTGDGATYRGVYNTTEFGTPCVHWHLKAPWAYSDEHKNYCRNFQSQQRPWCYVDPTPNKNWGINFCDIPICGKVYARYISIYISILYDGLTCTYWATCTYILVTAIFF
jgi:hypothetical protein